jgi:membrane associated rhomboid family serine protease
MLPLRDDQPRFSTPYVTYFLIGLNLVIFFFEWTLEVSNPASLQAVQYQFAVVPSQVSLFLSGSPKYSLFTTVLPFFTSMFLHVDWMHVISNMWALYIFGDNIDDHLGHFKYLLFYFLSGLAAMATQVVLNPYSNVPTLGASGAIAGVMGAYFILYPRARVLTWFFVFVLYLPAWIVLGYWFAFQFLTGAATLEITRHRTNVGGIAVWAHVGGFIAGVVMIKLFPARPRRYPYAYQ